MLFLCLMLAPASLLAANTQARLLLSATEVKPGETVLAGIQFKMNPGWHIYWKNPGDSGGAPEIQWNLPPGVSAGEIQWPTPEKYVQEGLATYVYHDEVVLLVPLTLSDRVPPGSLKIEADLDWLECEKICLPASGRVEAALAAGSLYAPSGDAPLLERARARLPSKDLPSPARAWWKDSGEDARTLVIEWETAETSVDFFPHANDEFEISAQTTVRRGDGTVRIETQVRRFEGAWPNQAAGLLLANPNIPEVAAYDVTLPIGEASASRGAGLPPSLLLMLLFAFIGGLILNIMPCVLPVISLKILGLVNQSKETPRQVRTLGLVYTSGVLVSFLVLAGIVIAVQQAGQLASWGMQFQSPRFLVFMTLLLMLVALNLFGVFEINVGGKTIGTASALAGREGIGGAFFHGILITLLSTPCTAPFLGAALGFAFAQPAPTVLLMFLMIGLGLASPYLILSLQPNWARFLPKPGAWMERFKTAMGFPMLGTAMWLFSLALGHFGADGALWLGLFLVLVALGAWVYGEFVQRGRGRRGLAMFTSAALIFGGYVYALEVELQWRSERVTYAGNHALPGGIAWQPWSPESVEGARAAGHPVLVDFTARWCVNCQFNKRTSIEIADVRAKLLEIDAVAFIADFTGKDANIAAELRRHGRAGVPLVLVYSADLNEPPQILPEVLTPGIVLNALEKAANSIPPRGQS